MACSNNTSTSTNGGCGCGCTPVTQVAPPCAPKCASSVAGNCMEYVNAACTVMNDSIKEYSVQKGDTIESVLQRLILAITNPGCVTANGISYSPIPLQSTATTNSTVNITWGASDANPSGDPAYEVQYKVNDPIIGTWTSLPLQSTTTATITGLLAMTSYEIRVRPVYPNTLNGSCFSVTIIVTTA
jgi:hypothetical protein